LVARVALRRLLIAALALIFAGFRIYWGVDWPPAAIAGVIVIGLGIAPLLPLVSEFAGAAASAEGVPWTSPPCASPSPSASRCCWPRASGTTGTDRRRLGVFLPWASAAKT